MDEALGWRLALCRIPYMTAQYAAALCRRYGDARQALEHRTRWRTLSSDEPPAAAWAQMGEALRDCAAANVLLIPYFDQKFPKRLFHISDCPAMLYLRGDRSALDVKHALGVVGSRRCTAYSRAQTVKMSRSLSSAGLCIVSGLADGIDAQAHLGALEGGGRTVAVLAGGVETCYPSINAPLYQRIRSSGGAILSDMPLGTPPEPHLFPRRNRLIAGLSDALLLMEATYQSGAWHTVDAALIQGKDVMCLPGPVTAEGSQLPHRLIQEGAHLVTCAADVLLALGLTLVLDEHPDAQPDQDTPEGVVLSLLRRSEQSFEELLTMTKLAPDALSTLLTQMELTGSVVKRPGRMYAVE